MMSATPTPKDMFVLWFIDETLWRTGEVLMITQQMQGLDRPARLLYLRRTFAILEASYLRVSCEGERLEQGVDACLEVGWPLW